MATYISERTGEVLQIPESGIIPYGPGSGYDTRTGRYVIYGSSESYGNVGELFAAQAASIDFPAQAFETNVINPAEYATKEAAEAMAAYLGGTAFPSSVGGPNAPQPNWAIRMPGGANLNAGALVQRYQMYPQWQADALTQAELRASGTSWTPPPLNAPGGSIPGTTSPSGTPGSEGTVTHEGTTTPSGPSTVTQAQPAAEKSLEEKMQEMAAGLGDLNWWQWNFIYQEVTGVVPNPPELYGAEGGAVISLSDYLSKSSSKSQERVSGGAPSQTPAAVMDWLAMLQAYGLMWVVDSLLYGAAAYARTRK